MLLRAAMGVARGWRKARDRLLARVHDGYRPLCRLRPVGEAAEYHAAVARRPAGAAGGRAVRNSDALRCRDCGLAGLHEHHEAVAEIADSVTEQACVFGDHVIPAHEPHWRFAEGGRRGCLGCSEVVYAQTLPR